MLILGCGKNRGVFLLRWFGSGNREVQGIRSLNQEMAFQVVRNSLARSLHSKEQVPVLLVRMVVCPVLQRGMIQKVMPALRSQTRPTLRILALVPPHCVDFDTKHRGIPAQKLLEYKFLYSAHGKCVRCMDYYARQPGLDVTCKSCNMNAREWAASSTGRKKRTTVPIPDDVERWLQRHNL